MLGLDTPKKRRRSFLPLLIIGPVLGIGAYVLYSKMKTGRQPEYDPRWQSPETKTLERDTWRTSNWTAFANPPAGTNETGMSAKAGELLHKQVLDLNGETIGEVEGVYYRSLSGEPEWLATSVGLADKKRVLVPLDGATVGEEIRLAQAKADIEAAPTVEELVLDEETEVLLYGHYGVRRTLPGVEEERNEENLRLREWQPAESVRAQTD